MHLLGGGLIALRVKSLVCCKQSVLAALASDSPSLRDSEHRAQRNFGKHIHLNTTSLLFSDRNSVGYRWQIENFSQKPRH